jgi:DNA-binding MarR family transcriptional regulator
MGANLEEWSLLERMTRVEQLVLRVGWLEQRRFAQDLVRFGVTLPQFIVLRLIALRGQPVNMQALADAALLRCATMTGIVDRLVRMGLVSRQRDAQDRRQVLVDLTPAGLVALQQVKSSRRQRLSETLERLSSQDATELLRLLGAYLEAFALQHQEEGLEQSDPGDLH